VPRVLSVYNCVLTMLCVASVQCDNGGTRRPREAPSPNIDAGNALIAAQIPRESNGAIVIRDAGDFLGTQCPGTRLWRITRAYVDGGDQGLAPRYYGRNDLGQVLSVKDVLLCELREMHWVTTPHPEGSNLLLWRGPWIFAPDQDCHWRPPFRTETTPTGRALIARERCARSANGGSSTEHSVTIEVTADYGDIHR
jgi:hypothetical protein